MKTKLFKTSKDYYEKQELQRFIKNAELGLTEEGVKLFSLLKPSQKILEVGTSVGRISFGLEKQLGFKNITAIDLVPNFIKTAKEKALTIGSNVKFEVGDVTKLRYNNGSFEHVLCLGVVLSYIIDYSMRIKALEEMFRVLSEGGTLIISARNYSQGGYMEIVKLLVRISRLLYNPNKYAPQVLPRLGIGGRPDLFFLRPSKPQIYFYEPAELIHDLLSVGFILKAFKTSTKQINSGTLNSGKYVATGYGIIAVAQKPIR